MHRPPPLRSPTPRRVRVIAFLLLVLQGLVAAGPLLEPRHVADVPRVHAEQKDAQHAGMHNEDTCALCSARTQVSMPTAAEPPFALTGHVDVATQDRRVTPAVIERSSRKSRAPPTRSV